LKQPGAFAPASPIRPRRRNRDKPERAGLGASVPSGPAPGPSPAAEVLAQGHRWLRFPDELEARFRDSALEARRKLVILCGIVGNIAICVGSVNLPQLMPDAPDVAMRYLYWILATSILAHTMLWKVPVRWRRHWQAELVPAVPILSVNIAVILDCRVTHADAMFAHLAALVSTLMYGCIATRMRFAWSLSCAALSFGAYVTFVQGTSPRQELIVASTAGLMALSYVMALVANYAFEYSERRNWLLRQVEGDQHQALVDAAARLHKLSIQDPLTQVANRRHFDTELSLAWSRAAFSKVPLAMLMVDVDHFKRYNDSHGHPAGDACLAKVAEALLDLADQHEGLAARLGGEEFALLLPGRTVAQAQALGTTLCERVRAAGIAHRASPVAGHVTVSVGAAQVWPAQCANAGTQLLMDLADQALYQAKEGGRDQTCSAGLACALAVPEPLPAPQADDDTADAIALSASAESAYTQILEGGFRRLRFPAEQERAFREHNAEPRRYHLLAASVLGVIIYNVYTYANKPMFSDIAHSVMLWQWGLAAAMLTLTVLNFLVKMPVMWREAIYSTGTAILGVSSAWFISQSELTTAISYSVCLALIPMFSGVAARQPFWFTCVPAVVTCLAAALLLHPRDAEQVLILQDSVTMIVTNTIFTLILSYTLEHGARKAWLLSRIEALQSQALAAATRKLHELSTMDPLTGIPNRRQFEDDMGRLWQESAKTRRPLAMLIVDVDYFKRYNDGYGHPQGDQCLKKVAQAIHETARDAQGRAARLGGEEFGVLLPAANEQRAVQVGERICEAVRQLGLEHRHSQVVGRTIVTVSVGACAMRASRRENAYSLFEFTDDALYCAKRDGRDRVGLPPPPDLAPTCASERASGHAGAEASSRPTGLAFATG